MDHLPLCALHSMDSDLAVPAFEGMQVDGGSRR